MATIEHNGFEIEVESPAYERLCQQDGEFASKAAQADEAPAPKAKRTKKAAQADEGDTLA